ncbi:MAG: NUDIX hydrolase [Gemmatimonadetes bacterium]|jgi:bis(5'-nucleosidyl)-tetraphosphatase|nr:NUDIX hydrolase [Gemmatimonadota bacterium]
MVIDDSWYERPPGIPERLAAGGVVVRREGDRLLVALARELDPAPPSWVLPKGGIDPGEDALSAARREIMEETGLSELTLLGKLAVSQKMPAHRDVWQVIQLFLYATTQVEGTPTDGDHHGEMGWFPLREPPAMFWPDQQRLLRDKRGQIEAAFARHLAWGT